MFIKDSYSRKKGKKYSCLALVETIRTERGPRQKHILTLGNIHLPKDKWKVLARMLSERLSGQKSLFPEPDELLSITESIVERLRRKGKIKATVENPEDIITTNVSGIKVEEPKILGPLIVADEFSKRLSMDSIFAETGFSKKDILLTKTEVFNRLISPMSENSTKEWVKRIALADMGNNNEKFINRDALYRITDKLLKKKEEIEEALRKREIDLFKLEDTVYLYDLTSSYFEGKILNNKKADYGHSRDNRSDCKQIIVGLVLDKDGFIKRHEAYKGNKQDVKTIIDIVKKLNEKIGDKEKRPTIIIDRGIVSEDNLSAIKEKEMDYIVATRYSERNKRFEEFEGLEMKEIEAKTGGKLKVVMKEIAGEIYVLCKSEERAKKDKGIRERFKKRIEDTLMKLQKRIESGKLKDEQKIQQMIGKIRQKYSRVARFYDIKIEEKNGMLYFKWEKTDKENEEYDGTYLLRTNRKDLNDSEIWYLYMMLTRIERAFRSLKSNLGLRPIYHQKEERADSHIFISILAYHLLHAIEETLRQKGDKRSWNTIKEILQTHQMVTVVLPDVDGKHIHHIRVATEPSAEQEEIYRKLGVKLKIKRKRVTFKKIDL